MAILACVLSSLGALIVFLEDLLVLLLGFHKGILEVVGICARLVSNLGLENPSPVYKRTFGVRKANG